MAVLLNAKIKGKTAFRAIFFLPMVVAPAAVAMVWKWIFNAEYGILNQVLGTNIRWLTDPKIVLVTCAIVSIWSSIGYDAVLLLSGIQNISQSCTKPPSWTVHPRSASSSALRCPWCRPPCLWCSLCG